MANRKFRKIFTMLVPEQIKKTSSRYGHFTMRASQTGDVSETFLRGYSPDWGGRQIGAWQGILLVLFLIMALCLLFLRLFHLQIVHGYTNRELADSNRIQVRIIHAPRGVIYDRNGKVLVQNDPGFRLIEKDSSGSAMIRHISRDEAIKVELSSESAHQQLEVDHIRAYPLGMKTAHILGYVGEITEEELKQPEYKNYRMGDKIGRSGIEQTYEKVLRGVDGGEIIEVDAQGKKIRTISETPALPGSNLTLTIESGLQEESYNQLLSAVEKAKSCCGSVVIESPKTGEILAMVSVPSYDPTDLSSALTNSHSPMLNRSISGTYPPGSTFKIASGLAGLVSGKITPSTSIEDTGIMRLGEFSYANWYFTQYGRTEGGVNLVKALQRSNDIYFYKLGEASGEQAIADTARMLGLGKELGIDLPGEEAGVIPDDAWKQKNIGDVWYPGDTLHMAIGQGFTLTTPLQISHLVSTIAADGKQYPPHLARKLTGSDGKIIKDYRYDALAAKNIAPEHLQVLKEGLALVPKEGGTAWPFFTFQVPTAGKTGTAEFGDPKNNTHAWYTSYAPVSNPELAITVLVEAGGEGSSVASPVAKEVYTWYFKQKPEFAERLKVATSSAKIATNSGRIASPSANTHGE